MRSDLKNKFKVPNFNAVIYDLNDYKEMIEPFCNSLVKNKEKYFLGPDDEKNKLNIWDNNDPEIKIFETIIDSIIFDFLDSEHQQFKGILGSILQIVGKVKEYTDIGNLF
jgi:hypothetical protein